MFLVYHFDFPLTIWELQETSIPNVKVLPFRNATSASNLLPSNIYKPYIEVKDIDKYKRIYIYYIVEASAYAIHNRIINKFNNDSRYRSQINELFFFQSNLCINSLIYLAGEKYLIDPYTQTHHISYGRIRKNMSYWCTFVLPHYCRYSNTVTRIGVLYCTFIFRNYSSQWGFLTFQQNWSENDWLEK